MTYIHVITHNMVCDAVAEAIKLFLSAEYRYAIGRDNARTFLCPRFNYTKYSGGPFVNTDRNSYRLLTDNSNVDCLYY